MMLPILIGCGCLALLALLAAAGVFTWYYVREHPSVLHPSGPGEKQPAQSPRAPAPDARWSPRGDVDAGYIAAARARVSGPLRFYEDSLSGDAEGGRQFRYGFDTARTRAIYWNLDLEDESRSQATPLLIEEIWYHNGREVVARQSLSTVIKPEWTTSYHYHGWGYARPGGWDLGSYRVVLSVDGVQIASGAFSVSDSRCSGAISMVTGAELAQYEREAESFRGQSGSAAARARERLAVAYHNRAGSCYLNGNPDQAVQYYTKALTLIPDFPLALVNRGRARADAGSLKDGIADATEAIRRDPKEASYYEARGQMRMEAGSNAEALEDLSRAVELNPGQTQFLAERGVAHWRLHDRQSALQDFETALKATPDQDAKQQIRQYIELVQHSYPIVPEHPEQFSNAVLPE